MRLQLSGSDLVAASRAADAADRRPAAPRPCPAVSEALG
ncbi:protein of unassigned function [Methylobacterium oryzae CBMB20]|uniref:Protein of unassigned function n=1 Tax=Methylobacterium oryzae CBMB20 TaxID=693986 RepID=A0A089NYI4_9HYPH|nr:protein of unassigned function [Methylobacterium oryzae CBMB20]